MTAHGTEGHDACVPRIGIDIYTFDGERLGTVAAIRRHHFKVRRRFMPGYWLSNELIHDCTPGRATLYIPRESIDAFRVGRTWPRSPEEEMQRWLLDPAPVAGAVPVSRARFPWRKAD